MANELFTELGKGTNSFSVMQPEKKSFDSYFVKAEKPKAFVALLVGDTGCGKTYVAMTFPGPLFIIDTENRAIFTKFYNFKNKDIRIFEPVQFKTEADISAFDDFKTIEEINNFIISFANEVKAGNIKQGTLVIDTTTDIWNFVQNWATTVMSNRLTPKGIRRADDITGEFTSQFDWKVPNKRHFEMIGILRSLIKYGIYVVFTAKEEKTPDYVKDKPLLFKDLIRAQKDVPFQADITLHLQFINGKYIASVKKFTGLSVPKGDIENINFDKIKALIEEQEEKIK